VWKKEKLAMKETLCIMNLCMAATYDPDPKAPLGFRVPFNLESGEAIEERWRNWRKHDPINLVARYRDKPQVAARHLHRLRLARPVSHPLRLAHPVGAPRRGRNPAPLRGIRRRPLRRRLRMDVSLPFLYRALKP